MCLFNVYSFFVLFSAVAALQISLLMLMFLLNVDRDLKPTNVLLDEDDRPVLMDLGSMNRARIEVRAVTARLSVTIVVTLKQSKVL